MKVQKVQLGINEITYTVIGEDYLPIDPINRYLIYIKKLGYSIYTIKTYATALSFFWRFLKYKRLAEWTNVQLEHCADFVHYLRSPRAGVDELFNFEAKRNENTINLYLAAVASFYDFHTMNGLIKMNPLYGNNVTTRSSFKSFLHHINKSKVHRNRNIKLKAPKKLPKVLSSEQIKEIINGCSNTRDQFLFTLLFESGMRIGQALGLRHSDIKSMDNEIHIVPRSDNVNLSRQKSSESNIVHVSKELMELYTDYIIYDLDDIETDYVFVNLWGGKIGEPLRYETVAKTVSRLRKKTGVPFYLHMFRHSHATNLIRNGWDLSFVQKRLGHKQIQTTANTYTHLSTDDMKAEFRKFQMKQKEKKED